MSASDNPDAASFRAKVVEEIKALESMVELQDGFRKVLSRPGSSEEQSIFGSIILGVSLRISYNALRNMKELKKIDELTARAREFLKEHETRELFCDRLRVVEDNLSRLTARDIEHDAEEIAGSITPLLFPLASAGSVSLPLDPLAFALCAWMIARTGIASYCAGVAEADPLSL